MDKNYQKLVLRNVLMGMGMGLVITALSYVIGFNLYCNGDVSVVKLHEQSPVFWVIDALFLVLGFVFYVFARFAANREANLLNLIDDEVAKNERIFDFAQKLSAGDVDAQFTLDNKNDELGKALINLRDSIALSKQEEEKRKKEDAQRNWITEGLAKFADLLRQDNDNLDNLSYNILSNLVKYLNANQGGFFVINDADEKDTFLELKASYAYERKKFVDKKILRGEGLAGTCWIEGESIFMSEVPDEYVHITSGIGEANPRCIYIVPLKINDEIHGVLELASFKVFEDFERQFVEKLAESIAATISSVKIAMRTADLLARSQVQADELRAKEEMMRQNMEELKATQEEAERQSEGFENFTNSVNHTLIRAEYNVDGSLEYANTKFLTKLGYSGNQEVMGRHVLSFIDPKDRQWFEKIWAGLSAGGKHFEGDMKHITKDGRDIWTQSTYVCVRNRIGEVDRILYLANDITDKKIQNLDFESQIEALNRTSIKAEFAPDGKYIDGNDFFHDIMLYSKVEFETKKIHDVISGEYTEFFRKLWNKVIDGTPYKGQLQVISKDGNEKWLEATFTGVNDIYGEMDKVIFIANDITDQKKLEIERQEQAEILKKRDVELQQTMQQMADFQKQLEATNKKVLAEKLKTEAILEGCVEGILTFDNNGVVLMFNKEAENILEVAKEKIVGANVSDFVSINIDGESQKVKYVGAGGERFLENNSKTEIMMKAIGSGEEKSVLVTLSEVRTESDLVYTLFLQNIDVELF